MGNYIVDVGGRKAPKRQLDDYPTPPWATRALFAHVLGSTFWLGRRFWEPACNRGHMAKVLHSMSTSVLCTDIHDYGYRGGASFNNGFGKLDFTEPRYWPERYHAYAGGSTSGDLHSLLKPVVVTNPPFNRAEEFVHTALEMGMPIAVFCRLSFLEAKGRYKCLFNPTKGTAPHIVAVFAERVTLMPGRLEGIERKGGSLVTYAWYVWKEAKPDPDRETKLVWIPPCRDQLEQPDDYA